jgi:hypothetical protein
LGFISQEGVHIDLIYLLVDIGSIWRSSLGGLNPWYSSSSTGRINNQGGCTNPIFLYWSYHIVFNLWETCLVFQEHFVAAHIFYAWSHLMIISDLFVYCIEFLLFSNKEVRSVLFGSISVC